MCRVDLSIDRLTDRHGRCVGSRIELNTPAEGEDDCNEVLVHAVNELAGSEGGRKGKLIMPLVISEQTRSLIPMVSAFPYRLRPNVLVEGRGSGGQIGPNATKTLRAARTMLGVGLALRTAGFTDENFEAAVRSMDPEIVVLDGQRAAAMVKTRNRAFLLDVSELCAKRGARIAVEGDFGDGDQAWLMDGGADMFVCQRFGARIMCSDLMRRETSRRLTKSADSQRMDSLDEIMSKLGVRSVLKVD